MYSILLCDEKFWDKNLHGFGILDPGNLLPQLPFHLICILFELPFLWMIFSSFHYSFDGFWTFFPSLNNLFDYLNPVDVRSFFLRQQNLWISKQLSVPCELLLVRSRADSTRQLNVGTISEEVTC